MEGRAKRSLSQNFLVDGNLQRRVARELGSQPDDVVLEIGPGHGELSQHLVGAVARLVLVEKDESLAAALDERWGDREDVCIVVGDALEIDLGSHLPEAASYRLISNVPYNITSPLLFAFLDLSPSAHRIVVTVQREVADRIVAAPGNKTYGALSVGVQARASARIAFRIGRRAFRPVPDVDSAVVCIEPRPDTLTASDALALRTLTRAAFGRRRKQLQKILRTSPEYALLPEQVRRVCTDLGLDPQARPEALTPHEFVGLARRLPVPSDLRPD
jgi:16S rRNA (adenine1518-N6/adenine1519-N6)-dimethyltransferase